MLLKITGFVVLMAICHAEDHAYSSQSIVLHHTQHKTHESHAPEYVPAEVSHESHGYEQEQHIPVATHESHEQHVPVEIVVPVVSKKVVPVAHYVVESSGHEQVEHKYEGHEQKDEHDHKTAFSSQHIERHDIPAPAPKGFYDEHGPSKYEFEYKVHDPHTHDVKHQHESRDGHAVHGVYSLHEADGSIRTVHYSADKKTGFQAEVKHTTNHVEESKKQR